jgi:hypothetical protein
MTSRLRCFDEDRRWLLRGARDFNAELSDGDVARSILLETLRALETRQVAAIALSGMTFDLLIPAGRMMATVLA